jgi:hypothetical protein
MTTEFPPLPNSSDFNAKFDDGAIPDLKTNGTALNAAKDAERKEAVIDAGLRSLDHCVPTQNPATTSRTRC